QDSVLCYFGAFLFFQAEDGIRDFHVTGVQTCALPIYGGGGTAGAGRSGEEPRVGHAEAAGGVGEEAPRPGLADELVEDAARLAEIGRASSRERPGWGLTGPGYKKKRTFTCDGRRAHHR